MENSIKTIVAIVSIPVLIFNALGLIVFGVWNLVLGEWGLLLLGLGVLFFSVFIISLLMMPVVGLSSIALKLIVRRNSIGASFFLFLSQVFIYSIFIGSSYYIFNASINVSDGAPTYVVVFWAYSLAIAPWSYMSSKENNENTTFTTLVLETALLIISLLIIWGNQDLSEAFGSAFILLISPILFTTWYGFKTLHYRGDTIITDAYYNGEYTSDELMFIVACMIYVSLADGKFQTSETTHIKNVFHELTNEKLSNSFIKNIYNRFGKNPDELLNIIRTGSYDMNEEIIEASLNMCKSVIKSDDKIYKTEKHYYDMLEKSIK